MPSARADTRGAAVRFVIAGGGNTLVTGLLLSLLALWIDPSLAYTIVFVLGIALSTWLAGAFVFRQRMTRRHVVYYVIVYVAVYVIGLLALRLAVAAGLPDGWSGLVVFVTAPLTFLGGKLVFDRLDERGRIRRAPSHQGPREARSQQ